MFIQFPCGCRALEINETEVLVVYSCEGDDDGRTFHPQNRRYFRRFQEAKPANVNLLQPWVDKINQDIRQAERFREAKAVLKNLLS